MIPSRESRRTPGRGPSVARCETTATEGDAQKLNSTHRSSAHDARVGPPNGMNCSGKLLLGSPVQHRQAASHKMQFARANAEVAGSYDPHWSVLPVGDRNRSVVYAFDTRALEPAECVSRNHQVRLFPLPAEEFARPREVRGGFSNAAKIDERQVLPPQESRATLTASQSASRQRARVYRCDRPVGDGHGKIRSALCEPPRRCHGRASSLFCPRKGERSVSPNCFGESIRPLLERSSVRAATPSHRVCRRRRTSPPGGFVEASVRWVPVAEVAERACRVVCDLCPFQGLPHPFHHRSLFAMGKTEGGIG